MTILRPVAFARAPAAGFDGLFDWDFLARCFPRGIMPMDIDAFNEINNRFLIIETKDGSAPVPAGQLQALRRLRAIGHGNITLVFLWGHNKRPPFMWRWERDEISSGSDPQPCTLATIQRFVIDWSRAADRGVSPRTMDQILLRATYPSSDGGCPF